MKKEYQIIATKDSEGRLLFTAQKRNVHLIFKGRFSKYIYCWKNIEPTMQPNYGLAESLIIIDGDKRQRRQ